MGVNDLEFETSITNDFGTLVGDPSFSATLSTFGIAAGNPFSLTEVFTITHEQPGFTGFDADSLVAPAPVPEPASCLLWATGAAVVGLWRIRRQHRA
jgi:hypothetical protein